MKRTHLVPVALLMSAPILCGQCKRIVAPTISPGSQQYVGESIRVTLRSNCEHNNIYYTLNGSDPSPTTPGVYRCTSVCTLTLRGKVTVKARSDGEATKCPRWQDHDVASATFVPACPRLDWPSADQIFPMTLADSTATVPVAYRTDGPAGNWSTNLTYQTSGGRGSLTTNNNFNTPVNTILNLHYADFGGRMKATVSAANCQPQSVTFYLTGGPMNPTAVSNFLVSLYATGTTPRLFTGVAEVESRSRHFCIPGKTCSSKQAPLYGILQYWPHESYDGGSHIGLLMVEPKNWGVVWNWKTNATTGVGLFVSEKLRYAKEMENKIRKYRRGPGLPSLTPRQLEDMALVLYGPSAKYGSVDAQYYRAKCSSGPTTNVTVIENNQRITYKRCGGGMWVWDVNDEYNNEGVEYVRDVRRSIK